MEFSSNFDGEKCHFIVLFLDTIVLKIEFFKAILPISFHIGVKHHNVYTTIVILVSQILPLIYFVNHLKKRFYQKRIITFQ